MKKTIFLAFLLGFVGSTAFGFSTLLPQQKRNNPQKGNGQKQSPPRRNPPAQKPQKQAPVVQQQTPVNNAQEPAPRPQTAGVEGSDSRQQAPPVQPPQAPVSQTPAHEAQPPKKEAPAAPPPAKAQAANTPSENEPKAQPAANSAENCSKTPAGSRNIQKSDCLGPPGAPVKAIYMHGLFEKRGSTGYTNLESKNRDKLEQLACKLNIRIAVPLSGNPTGQMHAWNTESNIKDVEKKARDACGGSLDVPRTLIGFSNGGYLARNIAASCDDHLKSSYSLIVMIGANGRQPRRQSYEGCPKFVFTKGQADGVSLRMGQSMLESYTRQGGTGESFTFPGGHIIPDAETMADKFGEAMTTKFKSPNTQPSESGRR